MPPIAPGLGGREAHGDVIIIYLMKRHIEKRICCSCIGNNARQLASLCAFVSLQMETAARTDCEEVK